MKEPRDGLSYDDVLLVPERSPVDSRSNVDLSTEIGEIELDLPIISSPMDTVTEDEMAIALAEGGGLGIIHRYQSVEDQVEQVSTVKNSGHKVGAAIGIEEKEYQTSVFERASSLVESEVDLICIDVAHGHLEKCLTATEQISDMFSDVHLMVGNVATVPGVIELHEAGADSIRVGLGNGSHCTTRDVTGVGVPQITALREASTAVDNIERRASLSGSDVSHPPSIIADGGITKSGDAAKALMTCADAVMLGGELAVREESAAKVDNIFGTRYKTVRGQSRIGSGATEGVENLLEEQGTVSELVEEYKEGLQSSLSYCGGESIPEAREDISFVKATPSTQQRNGSF